MDPDPTYKIQLPYQNDPMRRFLNTHQIHFDHIDYIFQL